MRETAEQDTGALLYALRMCALTQRTDRNAAIRRRTPSWLESVLHQDRGAAKMANDSGLADLRRVRTRETKGHFRAQRSNIAVCICSHPQISTARHLKCGRNRQR